MSAGVAPAAHFAGHGLNAGPSKQQIETFCRQYPGLAGSAGYSAQQKQEAEKLYKQYCRKQPAMKPAQPGLPEKPEAVAGRIDRIEGPSCAERGAEIRVRGRDLRRGDLTCRLESKGQRRALSAYSRTEQEYRFRLEELLAGPDYSVACQVAGDRDGIRLPACRAPAEQADGTDLVPEISAGPLRAGETQTVEVSVLNRGRSQPGNRRHRLVLVLAERDLGRTGLRSMSSALSPAAGQVLAHKRQWVMRVPGPGGAARVSIAMNVPARLPDTGNLYWCAFAEAAGGTYFVKGCVMVNDGTLDAAAVDDPDGETNPVEVNYGGEPDWLESLVRFAASDPLAPRVLWEGITTEIEGMDLEVYDLMHAPGGPNRDRILILVRAADVPGDIDPSATVPLELRVLGLPDSSEGRQGEVVWSGTVRVADFRETRLKSYWTDYRLPVGRRAVVRATIGEPPFAGDNLEMENLILQVAEERGGDDWGMFRIDYSTGRGDAALTFDVLYAWGVVPGADCVDMAGGRSPLTVMNGSLARGRNQSVRVMCVARDGSDIPADKFAPDGTVPLKLYAVLIPEYLPGSSMFRPWMFPPDMSGAAPDARTREAAAQDERIRGESGLADLVLESVELEYGTANGDLGPKFLHVTVANRGVSASTASEVTASFYREEYSGGRFFVVDVDLPVVSMAPGRSLRLTASVRRSPELVWGCLQCRGSESSVIRGGWIDAMVDAQGAILESDETNNRQSLRETRDYPASRGG